MPFRGKASKGCETCRRKKIRCDQRVGGCANCARVKLQCPGYRDQLDLAFRDESAEVARKVAAKADPGPVASSRTAESSSTSKRRTDPNGLLALLRQHDEASAIFAAQRVPSLSTLDDQATAFFYAHYLIPGADLGGPTRAPSELDETVLASIRAVGLAGLSRPALAPGGLHVETAKRYVNAIRRTNVALRDAEQVKKDSTLLATMMLGVFETMTGHTPSSLTAWISHIDGAAALVKLRGSEQLRTWNGRRLFLQATTYLMNNCLQRSLPLPKEIMDLTAELGTYMDGTDRIWRLHLASCDVVNFRADVRQDLQPGRTERLTRALELDRRLMHIFSELPLGWDYQIIQTEEDRDLVLTGYYHIYPNFFLVQVWNGARLMRMMLNEIICDDLVAGFAATPALFQVDEYLAHLTRSKETLSQLQAGVIASVPQHLGYTPRSPTSSSSFFSRSGSPLTTEYKFLWSSFASYRYLPSATPSPPPPPLPLLSSSPPDQDGRQQPTIRILGGFQMIGLLFYLGRMPKHRSSPRLRRWILRILRHLGSPTVWAIGQATALAKTLERLWEEEEDEDEEEDDDGAEWAEEERGKGKGRAGEEGDEEERGNEEEEEAERGTQS